MMVTKVTLQIFCTKSHQISAIQTHTHKDYKSWPCLEMCQLEHRTGKRKKKKKRLLYQHILVLLIVKKNKYSNNNPWEAQHHSQVLCHIWVIESWHLLLFLTLTLLWSLNNIAHTESTLNPSAHCILADLKVMSKTISRAIPIIRGTIIYHVQGKRFSPYIFSTPWSKAWYFNK